MSTIWDVLTAAGTVAAAIGVFYGFRKTDKALKNEKVAKYVERYEEILSHLPYNIFAKNDTPIEDTQEIRRWLVVFIDLCAEELFDRQRGVIDDIVWNDWENFIKEDFTRSALLRKVFEEVSSNYSCLKKFLETGIVPSLKECKNLRVNQMPTIGVQKS